MSRSEPNAIGMYREPALRPTGVGLALVLCFGALILSSLGIHAGNLDTIGLPEVRIVDPELDGAGVRVAQPEVSVSEGAWQVAPDKVGQPVSLFTWKTASASATNFPNALGTESWHANTVGRLLYSPAEGVAPGLDHVDNYDAQHYQDNYISAQMDVPASIINQSFVLDGDNFTIDRTYDNYVARHHKLIVAGAGNGGDVAPPATAYNVLSVGAWQGASSYGPTPDGRTKPDLVAPASFTSFAAPLVSGAAALLMQAGHRGDGGPGTTNMVNDPRVVKALLLAGATKPANWTNSEVHPLDLRYGAGVLNVFHSLLILRGGKWGPIKVESVAHDGPHPAPTNTPALRLRRGWNFETISTSNGEDRVHHYVMEVPGSPGQRFDVRATLVWERHLNKLGVNDLDLYLYSVDTGQELARSRSALDNVEHVWVRQVPPGRYDLQVVKRGGPKFTASATETYALAYDFGPFAPPRIVVRGIAPGQVQLELTAEPNENYLIEASTDLEHWSAMRTSRTAADGRASFTLPADVQRQFYRARLTR